MGRWNEIHAQAVEESKVTHKWINPCKKEHHITGCMWCDGGLECCAKCGAFEGATPDHCPNEQMTAVFSDAVYEGRINYRDGYWRFECAQVMRHIYDYDNYMLDAGYFQNEHGRWEKFPD